MLRTVVRSLGGGLLAAALIATSAPSAQAATQTKVQLPFTTFGDVVATNTRVFVSGGPTSTSIAVVRPTGTLVGEIRNLPGPTDLQLSPDRTTLYVALHGGGIAVFDTQSLRERTRYDTGDTCPGSMALSKRKLYFGYNCSRHEFEGNVGVIDLDLPTSPRYPLIAPATFGVPLLTAPANGSDLLLVSETTGTPGSIYVYASAPDGGLTRLRDSIDGSLGLSLADMTVSGDGSIAFSAAAEPYGIVEFATSDLSLRRVLPTGAFPNSVEVSSDGRLIAAGSFSCCGPDLFVFRADGTPTGVMELGDDLFARAVAWSPTGRRLYAVTGDAGWGARPAVLHVRNAPQ